MTPAQQSLAAEYALGLASGRDASRAAQLIREDPEFRAEAQSWIARLAALFDTMEGVEPPAALWARIERQLGGAAPAANDNVATLERQMRLWRGVTAMMTALAACFALLLLFRPAQQIVVPAPPTPVQQASAPMVAMVGEDQHDMMIVANWDPDQRRLVLAVAGDMPPDPGKSHQIWVIPPAGGPTSLGVMPDGKKMHMDLADQLAELLSQGATIAISLEPPGGSPTGQPTGPVMWSGKLQST
jgi:anti-sigma-K factor RskA